MCEQDELEAHIGAVRLPYRSLWLEESAALGLVAETLADALGWQPSPDAPLPDALALAEAAAERIRRHAPEYA
jgi:hypothetical protein